MSTLAFFIDDDRLPGVPMDSPDVRFVEGLPATECYSLDDWFEKRLLGELRKIEENVAPIFFIHANFKFNPGALRCFRFGLEVVEHIRFTRSLARNVRYAPIILYGFEASWRLAAYAPHSLLLPGAGLAFARLPEHWPSLVNPDCWPHWIEASGAFNERRMRERLAPGAALGGTELYAHSYRNLAGAGKFCWEFAGDILGPENHVLAHLRGMEDRDRMLKRLLAVLPDLSSGDPPRADKRHEFIETCSKIRFLVVDDEHDKGWSLGLYAGITGKSLSPGSYDSICRDVKDNGVGKCADGRMLVASRAQDAEGLFKRTTDELRENLLKWARAFDARDQAALALATAKREMENVEQSCRQSARLCTAALKIARDKRDNANIDLRRNANELDQLVRNGKGTIADSILEVLAEPAASEEKLFQAGRALPKFTAVVAACNDAIFRRAEADQAILGQESALAEATNQKTLAEEKVRIADNVWNRANGIYGACIRAVRDALPFETVFLDLRLEPNEDANLPIANVSGIRILKKVRCSFPAVPVIVMTASEKALSLEEALAAGASGYWIKGISTGEQMREIVSRAVTQAKLAPLWIRLQQIRARSYLNGKKLNLNNMNFEPSSIQTSNDQGMIQSLLEDSFSRIWGCTENWGDFNPVIMNLGKVHEIRYNVPEEFPIARRHRIWSETTGVEQLDHTVRLRRNEVAHPGPDTPAVTRDEALELLEYTVDQLLGDPS